MELESDAETLSGRLKAHPDLVEEFFSEAWLRRFDRPAVQERSVANRLRHYRQQAD